MNPLLTDYFNREKDAMSLYNATGKAARPDQRGLSMIHFSDTSTINHPIIL